MRAGTITITGHDGAPIEAYQAEPVDRGAVGGVVVLHHLPGHDEHTKEVTRRFAAAGYAALCPNLYSREAPGQPPEVAFKLIWGQGGLNDEQMVADVATCAAHLKQLPASNGKVGVIGFCSGGRQALLAACRTDLDATVDCYGSFVIEPPGPQVPLTIAPIADELPNLRCPVLGLFGLDDHNPAPAEVEALRVLLEAQGADATFRSYDKAGHAFFATNRGSYRHDAATAAWQEILDFFERTLAA